MGLRARLLASLLLLALAWNLVRFHSRVEGAGLAGGRRAGGAQPPSFPPAAPFPFPKRLHQIHANRSALSPEDVRLSSHCAALNDDFEYTFWNDSAVDELVRSRFPSDYGWWRSMEPPIKRIDASRYFILHAHGGAYIDFDVECVSRLRDVVADCPPGAAWLGGYPEPFQLMSDVGAEFWLHMLAHVRATLANLDAWTTTGPSGLNDAAKSYVAERGEAEVVVPFRSLRADAAWLAFAEGAHESVPWFVHNFRLPGWQPRPSGFKAGLGFLPNQARGSGSASLPAGSRTQVVDPGACAGSKDCPGGLCAPKWPVALYAHHCKGTWRGRIDHTR